MVYCYMTMLLCNAFQTIILKTFLWNIRTKVRVRGDYVVSRAAVRLWIRFGMTPLSIRRILSGVSYSRKWFREASPSKIQPSQYFHRIKYLNRCQIGSSIQHDTLLYCVIVTLRNWIWSCLELLDRWNCQINAPCQKVAFFLFNCCPSLGRSNGKRFFLAKCT